MPTDLRIYVPLSDALGEVLPRELLAPIDDALSLIAVDPSHSSLRWTATGIATSQRLVLTEEVAFDLPLISGARVRLGAPGELAYVDFAVSTSPVPWVSVDNLQVTLHLPPRYVKTYQRDSSDEWEPVTNDEGESIGYNLTWETGFRANFDGDIDIDFEEPELTGVAPVMIADTGLILDFSESVGGEDPGIAVITGTVPEPLREDVPVGFKGLWIRKVSIDYHKPGTSFPAITLEKAAIGSGGFSGSITFGDDLDEGESPDDLTAAQLADETGESLPGEAERLELEGMEAIFQHLSMVFVQSVPESARLAGYVKVPFADTWMKFEASFGGPDADFMLELGGAGGKPLIELEHEWFEIEAESIAYLTKDDVHYAEITGTLKPTLGDLDWPAFKADEMLISSEGDIELKGGWLELDEALVLDFHAFKISLSKFGMGTETKHEGEDTEYERQWLGLSGSVELVEGIPLRASVEGLRFDWPTNVEEAPDDEQGVHTSLEGIGVHLEIPETLVLDGSVSYKELTGDNPDGLTGHIFKGHIDLNIKALRTQVAGELIVGRLEDADGNEFTVFYIVLSAELPSPIVLGATGTGLYGLRGLFGAHIAPDRRLGDDDEPESWYAWYKADRGNDSEYSVTSVKKWAPKYDNWAIGAGLTLGTVYDDGFTINASALVAVLIPGPVIMIEGKANLLKQRSDDKKEEGAFYALAVFDGRAGNFQLNVDVRYSLEGVIGVGGGMEAFFDFNDSTAWYVHIGKKEPEAKRIQAEILSLIKAKAYFMIDHYGLQTGAFVGIEWKEEYGPVAVAIVARFSFDAAIFWKPLQVEGAIELYGEFALTLFGIGFELILQLLLEARAPTPYWIHGKAKLKLSMPWPLPTVDLEAEFTWEEPADPVPQTPVLTNAAMAHHKMPGASWALFANNADKLAARTDLEGETPPEAAPVVPVDSRPLLSFTRPLYDLPAQEDSLASQSFLGIAKDAVGDFELAYQLDDVKLEVYDGSGWSVVREGLNGAATADTFKIDDLSFAPDWQAQSPKVELWRTHALDTSPSTRREQYADRDDVCPEPFEAPTHCVTWQEVPAGTAYDKVFRYRGVRFRTGALRDERAHVTESENDHFLYTPRFLAIHLREAAGWLELDVASPDRLEVVAFHRGQRVDISETSESDGILQVTFEEAVDLVTVRATGRPVNTHIAAQPPAGRIYLRGFCYRRQADMERADESRRPRGGIEDTAAVGDELILEPSRSYRLSVSTRVDAEQIEPVREHQYFYFHTDEGPGTASTEPYDPEAGGGAPHGSTPLNELSTYVAHSTPAHGSPSFYRGYDVRVTFNEPYVAGLYPAELKVRIRDRNGRLVGPEAAEYAELVAGALDFRAMDLLPFGSLTFRNGSERGGCGGAGGRSRAPTLYRSGAVEMQPSRMYTAEVTTDEAAPADDPLHKVQFATSRYRTFTEHMSSGADERGGQVVRSMEAVPNPSSGALTGVSEARDELGTARRSLEAAIRREDAVDMAEARSKALERLEQLHEQCASTFDEIAEHCGHEEPKNPPAVELFAYPIEGDEGRVVLMLESPEPLDWHRITAFTRRSTPPRPGGGGFGRPGGGGSPGLPGFDPSIGGPGVGTGVGGGPPRALVPVAVDVIWNRDRTRAYLIVDGQLPISADEYSMQWRYQGDGFAELPIITVDGDVVDEQVSWVVALG